MGNDLGRPARPDGWMDRWMREKESESEAGRERVLIRIRLRGMMDGLV